MRENFRITVMPETIALLHDLLPPDASTAAIKAAAILAGYSYSTVWHIVRFYCRHQDAAWRTRSIVVPVIETEEE